MKTYVHEIDVREEGREEGILTTLFGLYKDGIITLKMATDRSGLPEQEFLEAVNRDNIN